MTPANPSCLPVVQQIGLFLGVAALSLLPANLLTVWLASRGVPDAYTALAAQLVGLIGCVLCAALPGGASRLHDASSSAAADLTTAVSVAATSSRAATAASVSAAASRLYFPGVLLIYVATMVLEAVGMSLTAKVIHPALLRRAGGLLNEALLTTQAGSSGRLLGSAYVTVLGNLVAVSASGAAAAPPSLSSSSSGGGSTAGGAPPRQSTTAADDEAAEEPESVHHLAVYAHWLYGAFACVAFVVFVLTLRVYKKLVK